MPRIFDRAYLGDNVVPIAEAKVSVASSAVLYGLSVYTVFPITITASGPAAFRLPEHYDRLVKSARIIGIDTFEPAWPYERFLATAKELAKANAPKEDVFVRTSVHVIEHVPGVRSRGLPTALSMFMYEAKPILPQDGARLKTSVWRRIPDDVIPSRAKVNGAYVNSVLGKQDALDSGYDDCLFLDANGHLCELSAANIFIVRDGTLITPGVANDILEGITRRTVLEIAKDFDIPSLERAVDLTELYVADEAFASGTSAVIAPIIEVDARKIGKGTPGPLTLRVREAVADALHGRNPAYQNYMTLL